MKASSLQPLLTLPKLIPSASGQAAHGSSKKNKNRFLRESKTKFFALLSGTYVIKIPNFSSNKALR